MERPRRAWMTYIKQRCSTNILQGTKRNQNYKTDPEINRKDLKYFWKMLSGPLPPP